MDPWIGVNLLIQYFKERYYSNGIVMPVKFTRLVLKKTEANARQNGHSTEGTSSNNPADMDDLYQYLDSIDESERAAAIEEAGGFEMEEDEEYRVRSAVITAIASIRAKDGMTPTIVLQFLETILVSDDASMVGEIISPDEEAMLRRKRLKSNIDDNDEIKESDAELIESGLEVASKLSYAPSMLVADILLALCHVNVKPALIDDPVTGKPVQAKGKHPVLPLMEACRKWLDWELYRESIRLEADEEACTGIGGGFHGPITACAINALSSLSILRQSTSDVPDSSIAAKPSFDSGKRHKSGSLDKLDDAVSSCVCD